MDFEQVRFQLYFFHQDAMLTSTFFPSSSFANNQFENPVSPPPTCSSQFSPDGNSPSEATAAGITFGVAFLFAGPAIALACWRKMKHQDHFFDVPPGEWTSEGQKAGDTG